MLLSQKIPILLQTVLHTCAQYLTVDLFSVIFCMTHTKTSPYLWENHNTLHYYKDSLPLNKDMVVVMAEVVGLVLAVALDIPILVVHRVNYVENLVIYSLIVGIILITHLLDLPLLQVFRILLLIQLISHHIWTLVWL